MIDKFTGDYAFLSNFYPSVIDGKYKTVEHAYQDCVLSNKDFFGNQCDWDSYVAAEGFAGMVKLGQTFEV